MRRWWEIQIPSPSILMQAFSNAISPSLFSCWNSTVALGGKKGIGWLFGRRQTGLGRRGTSIFIVPLIPDTSGRHTGHVRYTRAGPTYSKGCLLSSNPFLRCYSVQKGIWSWSKPSIITFLIQCHKLIFSFPSIWHKQDFAYLREIEWDNVDCGLKRAMSCVISRSNNQGEL